MNPRLQALAERRRTRRLHNHQPRPPVELPASFLATIWPPAQEARFTLMRSPVFRATWDTGRTVAATCWPARLDRRTHPKAWRLARIVWTVAGLGLYATTITAGLAAVLTRPVVSTITNAAGYMLVSAGWSPPLTDADLHRLADPERALFNDDHEHTRPYYLQPPAPADNTTNHDIPAPVDDGEWVDPVERARIQENEAAARHERQTAALEALTHQPATAPVAASTTAPVIAPQPQPVSFRRWALRALVVISLISAAGLLITAWTLAALSAGGTIPPPPTSDELIDGIHARTEQRVNDIGDHYADTQGAPNP